MKIYPIIPFSRELPDVPRNLGAAINDQIRLYPDDCWLSVQDYDVMWPQVEIPSMELMYQYVEKYPDTGLFTSYASRTRNPAQMYNNGELENIDSMKVWREVANALVQKYGSTLDILDIPHEISGFHLLFPKSVWNENPFRDDLNLLHVDNEFAWGVHRQQKPVRLMKAVLCLHYYRLHTDKFDTSHLGENKKP